MILGDFGFGGMMASFSKGKQINEDITNAGRHCEDFLKRSETHYLQQS